MIPFVTSMMSQLHLMCLSDSVGNGKVRLSGGYSRQIDDCLFPVLFSETTLPVLVYKA